VDNKYAVRRLAAVLILRSLAQRAPTLFFEAHRSMPKGFGTRAEASKHTVGGGSAYIWQAIMDKEKVEVRELGAAAYGAFIKLVHERAAYSDEHYREAVEEVDRNFERSAPHLDKAKVSLLKVDRVKLSRLGPREGDMPRHKPRQ